MVIGRITREEIDEVKRRHILENLLYTPTEAAHILAVSVRTIYRLVEDGCLAPANEGLKRTGIATRGLRITALSVEGYRKSITIEYEP